MEEKTLKTSWKQRIVIIVIAVLLLAATVLTYVLIVLNGNSSSNTASSDEEIAKLTEEYDAKTVELEEAAKPLSDKYFSDFVKYKSNVKAYNAETVNGEGLSTKDLREGTGRTLSENDTDYSAYYIGWCPNGDIFDSSLNDNENPTSLKAPLDPSVGLIEGWNQGVIGMKLGGVRQVEMSGDLAYGDSQKICGTTGSPLKFIILAVETDKKIAEINEELNAIYLQLYYAYYGNMSN